MLKKRIVPCLDINAGRTVKGVNFIDLIDAGDPVVLAKEYVLQGADELVFLDISATHEDRSTLTDLVNKVAAEINIPFTVGGGIATIDDARCLLDHGADKISINSAAVRDPSLILAIANEFGSQFVVLAVDAKCDDKDWMVYVNGGRIKTNWSCADWIYRGQELGAGEILLTSMDRDGTKDGFAIELYQEINATLEIPIIASGGAGSMSDFSDVFALADVDAALAASVFHFGEIAIPKLKEYLLDQNIPVRL